MSDLSIGLPGTTSPATIAGLAPLVEAAGFRTLWLNDTAQGDALAGLAVAAAVTTTLGLGVGVIALDRRSVAEIAAALPGLPLDRLTVGVGAGSPRDALARVRTGVEQLRATTSAAIVVGGLGPRMRQLAAEVADGVLLNWLTPAAATSATRDLHATASGARSILYVRTAVDAGAVPNLRGEAERYGGIASYAANLERIGATAMETTIVPDELAARLQEFGSGVDELVLRAITVDPSFDSLARFAERVAPSH